MSETSHGNGAGAQRPDDPKGDQSFLIVGLGGSAGAISAFREFFRNVPPQSGMAYVVILHLSPEYESRLAEVLQQATEMPVEQVTQAVRVEPDRVDVLLERRSDAAVLIVEDNGTGYDPEQEASSNSQKGMGVVNMRERATLVGGRLEIESTPGGGATIFVRVPFQTRPPAPQGEKELHP